MVISDPSKPFYLINESPASSTSTLVLRTPGFDTSEYAYNNIDEDALAGLEYDSSIYFAATTPSSPYMRSPGHSSPHALVQDSGIHDCPPESSSPLTSSPTSDCSYLVPVTLARSDSGTSTSASSEGSGLAEHPDALDEWHRYYSPIFREREGPKFGDQLGMDGFASGLYDRLLVVAREREAAGSNLMNDDGSCSESSSGLSYISSRAASGTTEPTMATGLATTNLDAQIRMPFGSRPQTRENDNYSGSDLDTPSFASPSISENITPPGQRKRSREKVGTRLDAVANDSLKSRPPPAAENREISAIERQSQYRLIWHAESFQMIQKQRQAQEEWEKEAPPLKRQKPNGYDHRQQFASKPASVRRAASLKFDYEFGARSELSYCDEELVPTEPTTPVAGTSPCSERSFLAYGVPIIAPPPDHVASLPVSSETVAKIRLQRLLEREFSLRHEDGLGVPDVCRQEVDLAATRQRDRNQNLGFTQKDLWEELLTVGQVLREDVVDWLLNVLPRSLASATPGSSFDSSTSCSSSSSSSGPDLFNELSSSPETRFHAVYVFLRFFYRVMSDESSIEQVTLSDGTRYLRRISEGSGSGRQASMDEEGRKLMIWDIAVGSLALSVKFHRDFLEPLSPVFAREYQDLAPHRLSFSDLENAQWDILTVLSYSLGTTPQPILDNLWLALPALRQLMDYEGGWNCALKETWLLLFEAISEPDALQYPLSLLTVACLVEGILAALIQKHNYMAKWRRSILERKAREGTYVKKKRQKTVQRIEESAEGVIHDIQAVIGISDVRLRECRLWLARIHEGKI